MKSSGGTESHTPYSVSLLGERIYFIIIIIFKDLVYYLFKGERESTSGKVGEAEGEGVAGSLLAQGSIL